MMFTYLWFIDTSTIDAGKPWYRLETGDEIICNDAWWVGGVWLSSSSEYIKVLNSSPPSATYMRYGIG